jgi:hypothetical protein
MLSKPISQLPSDYTSIKKKIDATYATCNAIWMAHQTEATIDTRLEAGDVSLNGDIGNNWAFYNGRAGYYFNRTRPLCNMVSGRQRDQRKSTVVLPLENGDEQTADQMTKVLLHLQKKNNFDDIFSEAFHQGACITGMNLVQMYIDFSDDPIFGDIKYKNLTYNQFFIDPYFRQKDLSDCQFVWVRSYLSHAEAAAVMPNQYYEDIMSLPGSPSGAGRDGRFQYMPQAYGLSQQNLLAYDEYYYRDFRERKILIDRESGVWREIRQEELDNTDFDAMLAQYPQVTIETQTIPTVRMAILIQDRVFYDGPNTFGIDCFPFVPVVGYYNPMMPYFYTRLQGICRSLRDPQMLLNRRIILSADLLESQVNSGWIFKENSVIDVKHLFQTGQGRVIPLKAEAQMTDVQQIQSPHIDASVFQLQETFSKELNMVTGINEELMGSAVDDKAGVLSMLRQGAGLVTLRPIFDHADFSLKLLGELTLKFVAANYGPMKIQQILEGEQPSPQFYNKAFGKYHCQVEEGYNTATQKQMQFAQLMELKTLGVNIPDSELLKAATIQHKTELIQGMEQQQQQAQQMQQMQAQMQMQQMQAQIELTQARAVADKGLGLERVSRVEENHALAIERKAQADKDEEIALLNFVKAIKELKSIDLDQIHRAVEISRALKEGNRSDQESRTSMQTNRSQLVGAL